MGLGSAFQIGCLLMLQLVWTPEVHAQANVFNVMNHGAVADGTTDNSQAFLKAWAQACQVKGSVLIPSGTYLVGPVLFTGPCIGPVGFVIKGTVKAPAGASSLKVPHWIAFQNVNGLSVGGGGSFDGQGASAWPTNTCSKDINCTPPPTSITFKSVTNSAVNSITSINSKAFHMIINECRGLQLNNIKISAPADSPNTDGIHIAGSTNVQIADSEIGTGDDCVSMGAGNKDIHITNIACGPGHGISVGSLGSAANDGDVVGVTVKHCTFKGTQNGVRIKTWAPSPSSTASNFTFEDLNMVDAANPLIIDQQYCPNKLCSGQGASRVQISDIKFINIQGTSSSKVAVNLQCSSSVPCQDIQLDNINLTYDGPGGPATSSCSNVKGVASGRQKPPSCI